MTPVAVRAPGKLFAIGEYAVLRGGTAMVIGVSEGLVATAEPSEAWRLDLPDLEIALDLGRGTAPVASTNDLVKALRAGVDAFGIETPVRVTIRATSDVLRSKRGLGGSGASVVALLGALVALAGRDPRASEVRAEILDLALRIQAGRGSGADVAASLFGGAIRYRPGEIPVPVSFEGGVAVAWSGRSTDTGSAIDAFEAVLATRPGRALASRLDSILDSFWSAVDSGDRCRSLSAVSAYGVALEELAALTGATGHAAVADLVTVARQAGARSEAGAAAKSSGAVGGDCAIVLAFDESRLEAAREAWRTVGARVLDLGIDRVGLRREPWDG